MQEGYKIEDGRDESDFICPSCNRDIAVCDCLDPREVCEDCDRDCDHCSELL